MPPGSVENLIFTSMFITQPPPTENPIFKWRLAIMPKTRYSLLDLLLHFLLEFNSWEGEKKQKWVPLLYHRRKIPWREVICRVLSNVHWQAELSIQNPQYRDEQNHYHISAQSHKVQATMCETCLWNLENESHTRVSNHLAKMTVGEWSDHAKENVVSKLLCMKESLLMQLIQRM